MKSVPKWALRVIAVFAFALSALVCHAQSVEWRDGQTNAFISSWKTNQSVKVKVSSGGPSGTTYALREGTGASGDRGYILTYLNPNQPFTFVPDRSPYRWGSYVWVSVIAIDRRGKETPLATLWRSGN